MNLENIVCNRELSEKLKELGVKQESLFYWCEYKDKYCVPVKAENPTVIYGNKGWEKQFITSAFTASELGEMLLNNYFAFTIENEPSDLIGNISCRMFGDKNKCYSKSLADAMAEMLIHLLQNKLVEA